MLKLSLAATLIALALAPMAHAEECDALVEYDGLAAEVTERFYDKSFNGLDWPARVAAHRAEISCGDDAQAMARVFNALLAELEASHTALYTQADLHYWGLNSLFARDHDVYVLPFAGYWAEPRDGRWYVTAVMENSAAARAGLRVGDELIARDGAPYRPIDDDATAALTVSSDGRSEREIMIEAPIQSVMKAFADASDASVQILTAGDRRAGYFHIWASDLQILASLNDALASYAALGVDAVIVDLRGGYGGTSVEYLDQLNRNPGLADAAKYFLIDDSVRSGKEMLAAIARRDGLATLVGATTSGTFLGGMALRPFEDKYFLFVAVGGGDIPDLPRIEGVGVAPDVAVAQCRAYCEGRDPILARALELVAGRG